MGLELELEYLSCGFNSCWGFTWPYEQHREGLARVV